MPHFNLRHSVPRFFASLLLGLAVFVGESFGQDVEFRAVVAPGLQRAEAVVPHATGAFLVSSTVLPESNLLRGYVAHFDADLNVDWTGFCPAPPSSKKFSMRGAMPPAR